MAGFSLRELAELPVESWAALYRAVRSIQLERMAADVGVIHASDPKDARNRLIRESKKVRSEGEAPVWSDPDKMKKMMIGVPGVKVIEQKVAG